VQPVASLPTFTANSFRSNPDGYDLFHDSTKHSPTAILPKASHYWHQSTHQPARYGSTYHTHTPTQWATQALALNLSKALALHLLHNLSRITSHIAHQRRTQRQANTATPAPFYLPPLPFLLPSPLIPNVPTATETLLPSASFPPGSDASPSSHP
jgi:hypothetical protein